MTCYNIILELENTMCYNLMELLALIQLHRKDSTRYFVSAKSVGTSQEESMQI